MLAEASLLVVLSVQQGQGTEACMQAPQLQRSVEKRLKRRVFVGAAEASLRLAVTFRKRGAETEASIELFSVDGAPRGTRSLITSNHCSALDDSLALSVALLVDQPPDPEPSVAPAPAPTQPAPLPARPRQPTPITLPPDVAAPREPWHVRLGVAVAAAWGVLPALEPGLALYVKLAPPHFLPILFQGEAFWPSDTSRDALSGARFRLVRAGLAVCPPLHESPQVALSLCFGQKLGWLTAEGYGFDHDRKERRLNYALTAGGEGRLRVFAPISLRGYLGAEVPLSRDRFTSGGRNAARLFEPARIAALGEIGLEAALW